MLNIEEYKKFIKESILDGAMSVGGVHEEKTDLRNDEVGGLLVGAGAQKVGDAITKMDPATFQAFINKIDKEGKALISKQMSAGGVAAPAPEAGAAPAPAPEAGADAAAPQAAGEAPPQAAGSEMDQISQELKDL